MLKQEVLYTIKNEISSIDIVLTQLKKIHKSSPDSLAGERAEYSIQQLNLTKQNLNHLLQELIKELKQSNEDTLNQNLNETTLTK